MLAPFAKQYSAGLNDLGFSGERVLNYYLRPQEGVSQANLIGRFGAVEYADTDLGQKVRAMCVMGGNLYAAAGSALWKITEGSATNVGGIPDGATTMAASADELAIVAGGKYYLYDGTTTSEYSTGSVSDAVGVAYMDGYFIVAGSAGGRGDAITISDLDNGKIFNALDFAFAESNPDALVGILRDHGELWLIGERSVELFYNSGDADFPFQRNVGAVIEQGCGTGSTIAKADNAVFWVRGDGAVLRSPGSTPQIISSAQVQEALAGAEIETAFTFSEGGSEFYAVRRVGGTTFVHDMRTGLWHERSTGLEEGPWTCTCRETYGGVEYFGTATGKIVTLSRDVFTDDGEVIEALATSQPIVKGGDFFRVNKVHLNIRGGVGGIGRQPRVMMQTSRDGRNWSTEKWRDLGAVGEYYRRAVWHALGVFRRFQIRIRITDAVPRDIYGVSIR